MLQRAGCERMATSHLPKATVAVLSLTSQLALGTTGCFIHPPAMGTLTQDGLGVHNAEFETKTGCLQMGQVIRPICASGLCI